MKNNKMRINLFLVVAFIMVVVSAGTFKNISVRAEEKNGIHEKSSDMINDGENVVLAASKNTNGGSIGSSLGDNDSTTSSAVGMVFADVSDDELVYVGTEITLATNTTGTTILFTIDGKYPTKKDGQKYENPIIIERDMTIKAIAIKNGENSEVLELNYSVYKSEGVISTVESGVVEFGTLIDLASKTTGAAVYYTIEDLDFKENSTTTGQVIKFENPIKIESNVKISAFSSKEGYLDSENSVFTYNVEKEILIQKDFNETVKAGEFTSFKLKAKNNKLEEQDVCIVLAAYNEKDKMIDYVMVSTTLTTSSTLIAESGFEVPEEASYIRGFIVDKYDSLEAISNIIRMDVEDK